MSATIAAGINTSSLTLSTMDFKSLRTFHSLKSTIFRSLSRGPFGITFCGIKVFSDGFSSPMTFTSVQQRFAKTSRHCESATMKYSMPQRQASLNSEILPSPRSFDQGIITPVKETGRRIRFTRNESFEFLKFKFFILNTSIKYPALFHGDFIF
jgi:hypothetical protein